MKDCPACSHLNSDAAEDCQSCGYEFESALDREETTFAKTEIKGLTTGDLIAGRYQVIRELGRGGMGVVYLVRDTRLRDREVALKMVHPQLVTHPEATQRFEDEVATCLDLFHRNIVRVYDLKRWEELRFFTMEYVAGKSLREWLNERKDQKPPFTLPEVLSVIGPLLEALSYAHQYTIHRDIKPENIMVIGEFPEVKIKVLDFGIAKTLSPSRFTQTAQALGTAYYMAPEQMEGGSEIDHRADLYSVGMVLYEMLTGEKAVGIPELPSKLSPKLPAETDDIVVRLLKRTPQDRHANAEEVRNDLARVISLHRERLEELQEEEAKHQREAERKRVEQLKLEEDKILAKKEAEREERRLAEAKGKRKTGYLVGGIFVLLLAGVVLFWVTGKEAPRKVSRVTPPTTPAPAAQLRTPETSPPVTIPGPEPEESPPPAPPPASVVTMGRLYLDTIPEGARIRVLNINPKYERGMELEKGSYHIEVSQAGYETQSKWVAVKAGEDNRYTFSLNPVRTGSVSVRSEPSGAKWYLDGSYEGTTPADKTDVEQGVHLVKVSKNGYEAWRKTIEIRLGQELAVQAELVSAKGKLFVATHPDRADIRILNADLAFHQGIELTPDRYHVEVSATGHKARRSWIEIVGGEVKNVEINLAKIEPPRTINNSIGMKFVLIPAGTFTMGSPSDESGRQDNERQHKVTISRAFYLQTTEVTQGQWKKVMGDNPSHFRNCGDNCPVERISWNAAQEFIKKLNRMEGTDRYRLPTEAEWEYACRAGTSTRFSFGDEENRLAEYAWYSANSNRRTHPVAQKKPNAWGLYDMHGNVWERCQDRYGDYPNGHVTDPEGPFLTRGRVSRGGSWRYNFAWSVRSASRFRNNPDHRNSGYIGFRVARDL